MVCRSTPGNSALTSFARLHSGLEDVQVLSMFHEARAEAPEGAQNPSTAEYQGFLNQAIARVRADQDLSDARRTSIITRLDRAMTQRPDARTYYAWRTIEERSRRARAALDAQFANLAVQHNTTPEQVEAAFNSLVERNLDEGRNAPAAPERVPFGSANLPHDRATRYALTLLHFARPSVANDDADAQRTSAARAAQEFSDSMADAPVQCPTCGRFAGEDHICPNVEPTPDEASASRPGPLTQATSRIHVTNGSWHSSDGERFDSRGAALRHEHNLVQQERRIETEQNAPREVPVPGLREVLERVTRVRAGSYRTTDGQEFTAPSHAARHERELLQRERQDEADHNRPLSLREARDQVRANAVDGEYVTSDGRRFGTRQVAAIQHERALSFAAAAQAPLTGDEALSALRAQLSGETAPAQGEPTTVEPGTRCENCGQFTGPRHICPENTDGEPWYSYDEHGNEIAPQVGDASDAIADNTDEVLGWLNTTLSDNAPAETPAEARSRDEALASLRERLTGEPAAPAPAPTRTRTPLRTYTPDGPLGLSVQMVNRSQILADLRRVELGEHVSLEGLTVSVPRRVAIVGHDGRTTMTTSGTYTVSGTASALATSARSRRGQDRITVNTTDTDTGERTLRCSCPEYGAPNYDCEHVRQVAETVQAVLNNRDAVAVAPAAAADEVRAALHAEYQDSLGAQQQARADFEQSNTGASYSEDMSAFQSAWDTAKERIATGDTALPYMTENVTGGLGARVGGRSFGIEIEVDFPDDMSYRAKNRVAQEIYEAGLSRSPEVRPWHWVGRAGGGYSDAPNNWSVEFDRSVDDVGGQRGCEIVSPILYDEAQTWENLAKVCEIIERHGGRATPRTGLHINVGAADYDHTVENHNRLLRLSSAYEDVLVRVSHNPESGSTHRGRTYCTPSQVPATGYRRIRDAQMGNSHRSMVNLDHVPNEDQQVTNSTRVEVRIFDGAVDPGRIQTNVKVALGLVNAATRGVEPANETEPAGTHRARNRSANGRARRLRGDEWAADTASFRAFADAIFSRPEDKAQMVHAFAATRWQAR